MKRGYYLSAYVHIDGYSHIVDYPARHDQNVSLWHLDETRNLKLVHYWELERVTGFKQHEKSFFDVKQAVAFINSLLSQYNLTMDDMNEIWGTPQLQTTDDYHSIQDFSDFNYHGLSHLFSAIMVDTNKFYNGTIIGVSIDHGPDSVIDKEGLTKRKYLYPGCIVKNGKVNLYSMHSPGMLWNYCHLRYKLKEGTLMALASATISELYDVEENLILIDEFGLINDKYKVLKEYICSLEDKIDTLTAADVGKRFSGFDPNFSMQENKISMVMKEVQKMTFRLMEKNIDTLLEKSGVLPNEAYLAVSGGCALNCPTNSHIMKKYKFKEFIGSPCTNDSGMSLGIALYAFHKKMEQFDFVLDHPYYGDQDNNIHVITKNQTYEPFIKDVSDLNLDQVVRDIQNHPIVWFNGAAEVGPRALGNRSLIADPTQLAAKDKLNEIKRRQWWRPVAPIILEDYLDEWFEQAYPSPFMLHTFEIKRDKLSKVPAIAHLDGSARIQSITRESNGTLYEVIDAFRQKTGVPIICNTSLNDNGEPIINKLEEAVNFALRKNIPVIYLNGQRIELTNHQDYEVKAPLPRAQHMLNISDRMFSLMKQKLDPFNIPVPILIFYSYQPELVEKYDILNQDHVKELIQYAEREFEHMGINTEFSI